MRTDRVSAREHQPEIGVGGEGDAGQTFVERIHPVVRLR
jgi:hypothetical protein